MQKLQKVGLIVKLNDIAKLAGVSAATVSRVFSHHPHISDEVRDRVLGIAREHGYQPRVSRKQRNVVIILPDNAIYPIRNCLEMVMMALTMKLPEHGFRIEVLPQSNLDRLENVQFCAAVAIGVDPEDFRSWPVRFTAPLVLVDREIRGGCEGIHCVRSDEAQGMHLAIGHFKERGCSTIGCIIYGRPGMGNADERCQAVNTALRERGYPADDALVHICEDEAYVETIGKMLKHGIDAIFCPGGNAGIVTAYALSLYSRRVPQDISLIASEHKLFSRYATTPQTTISQDHTGLAEIVCTIIEERLAGLAPVPRHILPYQLIIRDSVQRA